MFKFLIWFAAATVVLIIGIVIIYRNISSISDAMHKYLCDTDDDGNLHSSYSTYGLLFLSGLCSGICGAYNAIRFFIGPTGQYLEECKGPNTLFALILLGILLLHIVLPIIRFKDTKSIIKASAVGVAFITTIWVIVMLASFIVFIILMFSIVLSGWNRVGQDKDSKPQYANRPYDDCFGSETLRRVSDDIYQNLKGEDFQIDKYGNATRI